MPTLHTAARFLVVCVASSTIAEYCRKAKLPLITGYIIAGILCGPCVLTLLLRPESEALSALINDDAMGFIGFSAGSKFLLSELRGSLRPVLCLLAGLVGTTYLLVGFGVWFASPWLSLTSGATAEQRVAVSLIVACLAVARSPSSAIALVSELDAHGPFTTAVLSVTVLMDVVVVVLFAMTLLVVHALTDSVASHGSASTATVLGLFGAQMALSLAVTLTLTPPHNP